MSVFKILAVIVVWHQVDSEAQSGLTQKVTLGDTLHVSCQVYSGPRTVVWYKLDTSRKLQLLGSANTNKGHHVYTDSRYSVQSSESSNVLSVSRVTWEDGGTYFCGVMSQNDVRFVEGTVVEIESRVLQSVLQRTDYIIAQPGDSVTLSCSFNISHCPQEHTSVMWKRSSADLRIKTSGNDVITCQPRVNHREASCVHNLTLKDVSFADDGTYLCEVTACGDTLLGTGTRIHLLEQCRGESSHVAGLMTPTVLALGGLSTVLGVTVLVFVWVMCSNRILQAPEMDTVGCRSPENTQDEDGVIYATVNVVSRNATSTSIE